MASGDIHGLYFIEDFCEEAIKDCSAQGDCTGSVEYWIEEYDFHPDPDKTRKCLKEYGAWNDDELADDEENRKRLFWIMMGDFDEWDGTDSSPCGTDMYSLD